MDSQAEEEQQFEQVLHRLDALMKRGHGQPSSETAEAAATPAGDEVAAISEPATAEIYQLDNPDSSPAESIPILTDIYEDGEDGIPLLMEEVPAPMALEAELPERLLTELTVMMEQLLEEESQRFRAALQEKLKIEVSALLKRHLERGNDQTEM